MLKKYGKRMVSNPYGYASYFLGLDFYLKKPKEIVLVLPEDSNAQEYYDTIFKSYLPNKVVVYKNPLNKNESINNLTSYAKYYNSINNKPTIYVCTNFKCSLPVHTVEDMMRLFE